MRRSLRLAGVVAVSAVAVGSVSLLVHSPADAAAFTGGNLVVYRVGDGGGALSNAAAPVFVDEYSGAGSKIQSIALPTAAADGNHPLTATGLSRSEGLIARSSDGHSVTLTGYDAVPGTTGPSGKSLTASDPTSVGRVVGIVDSHGGVETSTELTTATSPKIVRSAVSTDGDRLYAAGGNGGIVTTTLGSTDKSVVSGTAASNLTSLTIQGNQLFTSGILANRLAKVGSGVPTAAAAATDVAGLPDNLLSYGYAFLDLTAQGYAGTTLDTLYLANASAAGGTVDKYTFDGTAWTKAGSTDVDGVFGLVANASGGTVTLAVTTPTKLLTITDTHGGSAVFTPGAPATLATAAANTEFRGVALAPTGTAGPSVFVRSPVTGTAVPKGTTSVSVSAYVTGSTLSSVTAKLGNGASVAATKGAGNIWTASVPVPAGGGTSLTVTAIDSAGTTTVSRSLAAASNVPAGSAGPGTYAWTDKLVKRAGTWSTFKAAFAPGKKGLTSSKKGSKLTLSAYGRSLVLTFVTGPKEGKAKITVDGKSKTVDLYAKKAGKKSVTYSFGSGALKKHAVSVTVVGSKSAKSKGTAVYVGAFQVKP